MEIKSVFENNALIPRKFTCDGFDINPEIEIINPPKETKSFALIVTDPDAPLGTWVHWLLWNISPDVKLIKENSVPLKALQGMNDFKRLKYGGPCPPGGVHRYFFKLYALDININLNEGSRIKSLEKCVKSHVLKKAELIGLYERR